MVQGTVSPFCLSFVFIFTRQNLRGKESKGFNLNRHPEWSRSNNL